MSWDAVDSLLYLDQETVLLDWVQGELIGTLGLDDEDPEVEPIMAALTRMQELVRKEAGRHYDGRESYSSGVPIVRRYRVPRAEPTKGGLGLVVESEVIAVMRPDGQPEDPPEPGGVWVPEAIGPEAKLGESK